MPLDQNADLSSRYTFLIDDGCLYVFDRNRKDPDGDDAIFAFIDRKGKGVFFEEPSPNEKACLKKMAESILKTDHHKKQEKEEIS